MCVCGCRDRRVQQRKATDEGRERLEGPESVVEQHLQGHDAMDVKEGEAGHIQVTPHPMTTTTCKTSSRRPLEAHEIDLSCAAGDTSGEAQPWRHGH